MKNFLALVFVSISALSLGFGLDLLLGQFAARLPGNVFPASCDLGSRCFSAPLVCPPFSPTR